VSATATDRRPTVAAVILGVVLGYVGGASGATSGLTTLGIRTGAPVAIPLGDAGASQGVGLGVAREDHRHPGVPLVTVASDGILSAGDYRRFLDAGSGTAGAPLPVCAAGEVATADGGTWHCTGSISSADMAYAIPLDCDAGKSVRCTYNVMLSQYACGCYGVATTAAYATTAGDAGFAIYAATAGTAGSATTATNAANVTIPCPAGYLRADGGTTWCAAAPTSSPIVYPLATGALASDYTPRVAGGAYIDPTLATGTCAWEVVGSTTSASATLYATLVDAADAGLTSVLSLAGVSSQRVVSGTITWPAGARTYELRVAVDGGTTTDYGLAAQADVRCQ
jgi:hypothetical protein